MNPLKRPGNINELIRINMCVANRLLETIDTPAEFEGLQKNVLIETSPSQQLRAASHVPNEDKPLDEILPIIRLSALTKSGFATKVEAESHYVGRCHELANFFLNQVHRMAHSDCKCQPIVSPLAMIDLSSNYNFSARNRREAKDLTAKLITNKGRLVIAICDNDGLCTNLQALAPLFQPLVDHIREASLFIWYDNDNYRFFKISTILDTLKTVECNGRITDMDCFNFLYEVSQVALGKDMISKGFQLMRTQLEKGRNALPIVFEDAAPSNRLEKVLFELTGCDTEIQPPSHRSMSSTIAAEAHDITGASEEWPEMYEGLQMFDPMTEPTVSETPKKLKLFSENSDARDWSEAAKNDRMWESNRTKRIQRYVPAVNENGQLECPEPGCDFQALQIRQIISHIADKAEIGRPCRLCPMESSKIITSKSNAASHTRTHFTESATCNICGAELSGTISLNSHLARIHGGKETSAQPFESLRDDCAEAEMSEEKFLCAHCDKTYTSANKVRIHWDTVHAPKTEICPHCQKPQRKALVAHHRARCKALGKRTARCPMCQKVLHYDHMATHILKHGESEEVRAWAARFESYEAEGIEGEDMGEEEIETRVETN